MDLANAMSNPVLINRITSTSLLTSSQRAEPTLAVLRASGTVGPLFREPNLSTKLQESPPAVTVRRRI